MSDIDPRYFSTFGKIPHKDKESSPVFFRKKGKKQKKGINAVTYNSNKCKHCGSINISTVNRTQYCHNIGCGKST